MAILTTEEKKMIQYLAVYSLECLNAIFSQTGKVHKKLNSQERWLLTYLLSVPQTLVKNQQTFAGVFPSISAQRQKD